MTKITIEGQLVDVGDDWDKLSNEEKGQRVDQRAKEMMIPNPTAPPAYKGGILPISRTEDGRIRPDLTAGLPATIARSLFDAFKLPGDVVTGAQPAIDPLTGRTDPGLTTRAIEAAPLLAGATPAALAGNRSYLQTPTAKDLMEAGNQQFNLARGSGSEIYGPAARQTVQNLEDAYRLQGRVGKTAEKTRETVASMAPNWGSNTDLDLLLSHRDTLMKTIVAGTDAQETAAAAQAVKAIDALLADPKAQLGGTIAAPELAQILQTARGNQAAAHRSGELTGGGLTKEVSGITEQAALQAGATHSGKNYDNLVRQAVVRFIKDRENVLGYSDAEIELLKSVAAGTAPQNVVRWAANFLGGGGGLAANRTAASVGGLAGGAALYSGVEPAVAGGIGLMAGGAATQAGSALKAAENALARRNMAAVDEAIRQRSPLYETRVARQDPASSATGLLGENLTARDLAVMRILGPGLLGGQPLPRTRLEIDEPPRRLPPGYI